MRIERRYTETGKSPYAGIEFRTTTSEIRNPDGSVVFQLKDIEVPADWSQVACDVLAQKYFRKAGIPQRLKPVAEADMPVWLCRHAPDEAALSSLEPAQRMGGETKATKRSSRASPRRIASSARPRRSRSSIVSPAPGPIGAGRAAISTARPTPAISTTRCAT